MKGGTVQIWLWKKLLLAWGCRGVALDFGVLWLNYDFAVALRFGLSPT